MNQLATQGAARGKASDILGKRRIEHVVVLGANGTMGFGSGALFTHAVPKVTFLARTKAKAEDGLKAAIRQVRSPTVADRVECGSYEEDLERAVASADLIFEAVTEQLELKQQFFERIDKARRPDSIVGTVTSGLSINKLAEGRSESFRKHFMGIHFFNPPNVIVGTELVAGKDTDSELLDFVETYCEKLLGRTMIRTADTPGFAGNRVGFKVLNEVAQLAEEHGPALMDKLVGPYTGRALAPLGTIDLVGWDIHKAIVDNIYKLSKDEAHATLELPAYMQRLIDKGTLGNKSGGGFFQRTKDKKKLVLNPKTGEYTPLEEVKLPNLGFIKEIATLHRMGRYEDAMAAFVSAPGDEAALARKVIAGYISYGFHRAGECTEAITGIDLIMGTGFNWAPPSVLVDTIGVSRTVDMLKAAGVPVPKLLADALPGQRFFNHPTVNVGRFFVAR
ncbi:MAG: 3-hydroxyacyl-CoA dehydrogenase family protein [Polyangiaceae bacterium]